MKIFKKIETIIYSIKVSIKRFPITIFISSILVALLIYYNELRLSNSLTNKETLERIIMVVALAIPLSLCIGLLKERFFDRHRNKSLFAYLVGLLFLVLYFFFLLKDFSMIPMVRYFGIMIFLILAFFYIPWLNRESNYENYVIKVFSSFFLTVVYAGVLYIGLSAIVFTIDQLFEVDIKSKIYYYMFLVVSLMFGISLFLSKIPEPNEDFKDFNYSKSLKVLLVYIVIPLITAYTLILYAYFVKILVTWVWPKGLVSHLVLWYSVISVGVIFLITPVLEESKLAKTFKIWFPKAILPILVMMFMSIFQRVNQYGITENRYYIVVLGVWVFGIMLYFSFKKPLKNIVIPITLSIIVLNSVFGPLSSFSISKYSQNNRLDSLLEKNRMLQNGEIVKNDNISKEDQREISNILSYFVTSHSVEDVKYLPKDFSTTKMEDVFGFAYNPYSPYDYRNEEYFYYGTNSRQVISIEGYDYYLSLSSWDEQETNIDDLSIRYDRNNHILSISIGGKSVLSQEMIELARKIHENQIIKDNPNKEIKNLEDMTFEIDNQFIRTKFIFTSVSLKNLRDINEIQIESMDFILIVDKK